MSNSSAPFPDALKARYHAWKASTYANQKARHEDLARNGQRPETMIISCCDSRVSPTALLGGSVGDYFVHRNIAALVPAFADRDKHSGTAATIEYAVEHLGVRNIIVMGHSLCGGVAACHDIAPDPNSPLNDDASAIGPWLKILAPEVEALEGSTRDERVAALEKRSVALGIRNLATYPFVSKAQQAGALSLLGLWTDVGSGELFVLNPATGGFEPV